MSTELPFALVKAPDAALEVKPKSSAWLETAVAVLFAATAILFVSFVAVMTGIV
jgi:hypothetical protein